MLIERSLLFFRDFNRSSCLAALDEYFSFRFEYRSADRFRLSLERLRRFTRLSDGLSRSLDRRCSSVRRLLLRSSCRVSRRLSPAHSSRDRLRLLLPSPDTLRRLLCDELASFESFDRPSVLIFSASSCFFLYSSYFAELITLPYCAYSCFETGCTMNSLSASRTPPNAIFTITRPA